MSWREQLGLPLSAAAKQARVLVPADAEYVANLVAREKVLLSPAAAQIASAQFEESAQRDEIRTSELVVGLRIADVARTLWGNRATLISTGRCTHTYLVRATADDVAPTCWKLALPSDAAALETEYRNAASMAGSSLAVAFTEAQTRANGLQFLDVRPDGAKNDEEDVRKIIPAIEYKWLGESAHNLAEHMEHLRPLNPTSIMYDLLAIAALLNERQVVHGAITPSNILVTDEGRHAVLCGFGSASPFYTGTFHRRANVSSIGTWFIIVAG